MMWMGQSLIKLMPTIDIPLDLGGGLNVPTLGFTVVIVTVATLIFWHRAGARVGAGGPERDAERERPSRRRRN